MDAGGQKVSRLYEDTFRNAADGNVRNVESDIIGAGELLLSGFVIFRSCAFGCNFFCFRGRG